MKVRHVPLHEKFSDSMPVWLKNYLLYNNTNSKYRDPAYRGFAAASARDVGRDDAIGPAIKVFKDKGLDENKVTIISQPLPSSLNDPIFSDPDKMCLIHLRSDNDETLYIPNHTAPHERFTLDDGKVTTLNYLNNKQYKQYAKDFAYIDLTDPTNFGKGKIRQDRANVRKTMPQRNRKYGREAEKHTSWVSQEYDKSGYRKIPAARKYANKLAQYKVARLPQKLLDIRDKLADAVKLVNNFKNDYLYSFDLDRLSKLDRQEQGMLRSAIKDADDFLRAALTYFYEALTSIDTLPDPSSGQTVSSWYISEINNTLRRIENNIRNATNTINSFLPKAIDWDPNDASIFSDDDWSDYM